MKIIIAGAGEVGFHLARLLSNESQDIVLIDSDPVRLEYAESHLDVITLRGNATSPRLLIESGVEKADILLAVTSSETTNLTICIIGKRLGAKRTIPRISNTEFLKNKERLKLSELGIDTMISPEDLAAKEIKLLIKKSAFSDYYEFSKGMLSLLGFTAKENCPLIGKSVMEIAVEYPKLNFMPVAIQRGMETVIPKGNTIFLEKDHVFFIVPPSSIDILAKISGNESIKINNIMILGASKIGYKTARNLHEKYNITIIEKDRDKCFQLVDGLGSALVINGDGRNVELLEEENLSEMDAFIAVTGNSETNIMSCLVAKSHGVRKTIALVENIDYINLSQTIGIDSLINKKLIAASNIFKFVRKGKVQSIASLHGVKGEILEFIVKVDSEITTDIIRDLGFPEDAIIGGVIRKDASIIPLGDFQILPNDRVVVFCLPEAISKVEKFFG